MFTKFVKGGQQVEKQLFSCYACVGALQGVSTEKQPKTMYSNWKQYHSHPSCLDHIWTEETQESHFIVHDPKDTHNELPATITKQYAFGLLLEQKQWIR